MPIDFTKLQRDPKEDERVPGRYISLYVAQDYCDQMDAIVEELHCTRTAFIRAAIDNAMEEYRTNTPQAVPVAPGDED